MFCIFNIQTCVFLAGDLPYDDDLTSMFFLGTEDGQVIYGNWKVQRDLESGKVTASRPSFVSTIHAGPVCTVQRSPFFRDIILTVGGWTFAIWKETNLVAPLLHSASHPKRLTAGYWSPSRPGVFFIAKIDGNIDVWDLLDRTHEPFLSQNVSAAALSCAVPHQIGPKQQLLAVADTVGTLHIFELPWSLRHASQTEVASMQNYFDREIERIADMVERQEKREKAPPPPASPQKGQLTVEKSQEELDNEMLKEFEKYLAQEKQWLQQLGVKTKEEDAPEI